MRISAAFHSWRVKISRIFSLLTATVSCRDLTAIKAAPPRRQISAAVGTGSPDKIQRSLRSSNTVIVEIHSISLEPGSFTQEPTTFLSLDFYAHDTQNTYPATGLDVELGWSCEFVVEVDEVEDHPFPHSIQFPGPLPTPPPYLQTAPSNPQTTAHST